MLNLQNYFKNDSTTLIIGIICIFLIGIPDYLVGHKISLALFYIFPILYNTWFTKYQYGNILALLSAFVASFTTYMVCTESQKNVTFIINFILYYGIFSIIVYLVHKVKILLQNEHILSRTDPTTELLNVRAFTEKFIEIDNLSSRLKLQYCIIYIDIDNFKLINDNFSHQEGDRILTLFAKTLKNNVRKTDIVARIGGDEFCLLLPSTTLSQVKILLTNLINKVKTDVITLDNNAVLCSIGCLCVHHTNNNIHVEHILKEVDQLMYTIKNSTKNNIAYKEVNYI